MQKNVDKGLELSSSDIYRRSIRAQQSQLEIDVEMVEISRLWTKQQKLRFLDTENGKSKMISQSENFHFVNIYLQFELLCILLQIQSQTPYESNRYLQHSRGYWRKMSWRSNNQRFIYTRLCITYLTLLERTLCSLS